MRYTRLGLFSLPLLFGFAWSITASAQLPTPRPSPLPALGRNVVGNGDTTTLIQNPANLVLLPGTEFRYTGYFLGDTAAVPTGGHALAVGLPFGFIPVATGLRFDIVTPSSTAAQSMLSRQFEYQWLTWGLAAGTESASLGVSFQRSFSDAAAFHGFGTWSVGANLRPADYFGMAAVIRNVDAPASAAGSLLPTEYVLGAAVRPLGTDRLEIGLEGTYVDDQGGYWEPRATLDVGIGTLGRIRGDFVWTAPDADVETPAWVASTALVMHGNTRRGSGELTVGARYGDGLGATSGGRPWENIHAEVAVKGFRETFAAENVSYAVRIRMEKSPSVREHTKLLQSLWRMADQERNLKAVLLEIRTQPADSLAHLQELMDAILYLKQKGKRVVCHLETATGAALILCSQADKVFINPAGTIHYSGLKTRSFYVKGLLDKLGVSADFVRIGDYKSAPEMFARREASGPATDVRVDLLQQIEHELTTSLARGRKLRVETIRKVIERGPYTALEAEKLRLVDGYAFDDMLEDKISDLVGEPLIFEEGDPAATRPSRFGPQKRLAIVYVDGNMIDGRSQVFPFVGIHTVGSYTIAETLEQLRKDPSVGAVVLRVESGGGSAMAADVMWRQIRLLSEKKPVVVSMGSAAASGGYYIAAAGDYIYANPLSVTGSIGVYFSKVDVSGLLRKVGVNVETLRTTDHADAETVFRPFSDQEREILKRKVEQFYGMFLSRVAEGREMSREEIDAVGRGRVWTGRQALDHGLVDSLGGLRQALAKARVMGGIADDAPVIELPVIKTTLLGRVLGVEGLRAEVKKSQALLPGEMMDMVRTVAPFALYTDGQPMARVEALPELLP